MHAACYCSQYSIYKFWWTNPTSWKRFISKRAMISILTLKKKDFKKSMIDPFISHTYIYYKNWIKSWYKFLLDVSYSNNYFFRSTYSLIPCHAMHHVVHSQSAAQVEKGIPSFTWYVTSNQPTGFSSLPFVVLQLTRAKNLFLK